MELRVVDGRAVLVGRDTSGQRRAVDPAALALGTELTAALHEWARVVGTLYGADPSAAGGSAGAAAGDAGSLVSVRGRQLAGRVAAAMGVPVRYADPRTGELDVVEPSAVAPARSRGRMRMALDSAAVAWRAAGAGPTPWATGLTVSAVTGLLALLVMLALSAALFETGVVLSLLANLVITAGLAPSVWLLGRLVVWRWVAYGLLGGLAVGWVVWLFGLLRLL